MAKPTDIRIVDVQVDTEYIKYRAPIKFGGRVTTDATLLNVTVTAETARGRRGQGFGSMPMGNSWAWPTSKVSMEQTKEAMVVVGRRIAQEAGEYRGSGHPLDITHDLAVRYGAVAEEVVRAGGLAESMPRLAQLVAASPTEAAIHDAYGKALGENSYNLLGPEFVQRDLSEYLGAEFAGEYLDRYALRQPKPRMPLYHLIGAPRPADGCRRRPTHQRRPAGNFTRMDRQPTV